MDLTDAFTKWSKKNKGGWGLAWFLAAEFCRRFYASHGIVPHVNEHEGLGYYGILVEELGCPVHGKPATLGRFTIEGDVEPWALIPDSIGQHTVPLVDRMKAGVPPADLVKQAIAAFRLPPFPEKSHRNCRHRRWGASYALVFDLAARLALRHDFDTVEIWNHPYHTEHVARANDPKFDQREHPGHFLFRSRGREVLVAGDGRVVLPTSEPSLWERYMASESEEELLAWLVKTLGLPKK